MSIKTGVTSNQKQSAKTSRPTKAFRSGVTRTLPSRKRIPRKDIRRVVDRIVSSVAPEQVILFGSYAYGTPTQDSDVDLLVVMESDERPNLRATRVLGQIHEVKNFPMDILVRTPEEIQRRLEMKDQFMQEILERGLVLYERRVHVI